LSNSKVSSKEYIIVREPTELTRKQIYLPSEKNDATGLPKNNINFNPPGQKNQGIAATNKTLMTHFKKNIAQKNKRAKSASGYRSKAITFYSCFMMFYRECTIFKH